MFRIDRKRVQLSGSADIPTTIEDCFAYEDPPVQEEPPQTAEPAGLPGNEDGGESAAAAIASPEEIAAGIIASAEDQSRQLLQEAEQRAAEMFAEARRKGYDEGLVEGRRSFDTQLESNARAVCELLDEIAAARDEMFASMEGPVIDLTLAIARKIININLQSDRSMFESIIAGALAEMKSEGKINIRVSQEQYDAFFKAGGAGTALGDASAFIIVGDPTLAFGDLLLEADGETLNAGVDSQLRYITIAFNRSEDSR